MGGTEETHPAPHTSLWELTLSERENASILIENTTVTPFTFCRYYFKCFYCNQQYPDIKILLEHTLTHNIPRQDVILKEYLPKGKRTVKVDISSLKCRICDKKSNNIDDIRDHLATQHGKSFTESGSGLVAYDLTYKDGLFSCHLCEKTTQTFILLNRHMNVHFSNAVCNICGAGFMTHQRLLHHKQIHQPGGFPCKKCTKVYTSAANLKFHNERAHECASTKRMFKCPQCSERFAEHRKKLKHLSEAHGIKFTYSCDICKSLFPSRRALTTHTNKMHTGKIKCEICKKIFGCVTTLKRHKFSHSKEKSFVCNICQKTYKHQRSLQMHMKTHVKKEVQ